MKKLNTNELIESLAQDLNHPSDSRHWFTHYWFGWLGCLSILATLTYLAAAALPQDIHLPHDLHHFAFWFEALLWLGLAFISAVISFRSALMKEFSRVHAIGAYSLASLLLVSILSRWSPEAIAQDVSKELSLTQGPCGIFIGFTGLIGALWMFMILRKATPTRLGYTGAWSAVSVGALASMFMHLVCTHEGSMHEFIWHVIPLVILVVIASSVSKKVLRW